MIDGVEKWNRFPLAGGGVAFLADLEAQHQVEMGQPRLAATLSRQGDAGTSRTDVGFEDAEAFHPIRAASGRVPVLRVKQTRLEQAWSINAADDRSLYTVSTGPHRCRPNAVPMHIDAMGSV